MQSPIPPQLALSSTQLGALEAESIHIIREVVAEFDRPALLFPAVKTLLSCFT